jgi:hypothetical protein
LVSPQPGDSRGTPYGATDWLREAVVPLTSAVGWERQFIPAPVAQIGRLDVEAAFLLSIPLMVLNSEITGKCRLSVEVRAGSVPSFAGVVVAIEAGKVVSCTSRLEGDTNASASGSAPSWMRQMNGGPPGQLKISGNFPLAEAITSALRALPEVLVRS